MFQNDHPNPNIGHCIPTLILTPAVEIELFVSLAGHVIKTDLCPKLHRATFNQTSCSSGVIRNQRAKIRRFWYEENSQNLFSKNFEKFGRAIYSEGAISDIVFGFKKVWDVVKWIIVNSETIIVPNSLISFPTPQPLCRQLWFPAHCTYSYKELGSDFRH